MDHMTARKIGIDLFNAAKTRKPMIHPSVAYNEITVDDAYVIQSAMNEEYLRNGYTYAGKKVGLTSKAMRELSGIEEPDYGYIFRESIYENGSHIKIDEFLYPMVETEIAFVFKKDLDSKDIGYDQVVEATDFVVAAFELIDFRTGFEGRTIYDSIADNAAFGACVLGDTPVDINSVDLSLIGLTLDKNGDQIGVGSGAAVMDDPVNAIVWLAKKFIELGNPIKKGELVLSGSAIAAVEAKKGDYFRAKFSKLGEIDVKFI